MEDTFKLEKVCYHYVNHKSLRDHDFILGREEEIISKTFHEETEFQK
jgi:hypothetical protein